MRPLVLTLVFLAAMTFGCSSRGQQQTTLDLRPGTDIRGEPGDDGVSPGDDATILDSGGLDTGEDTPTPPEPYSLSFLEDVCQGYCEAQDACGDGILDLEVCKADCIEAAQDPDFLAQAVCFSLLTRDDDGVDCDLFPQCEAPVPDEGCLETCNDLADCDFLGPEIASWLGTTAQECLLLCGGYSALTPHQSFQEGMACISDAAEQCDFSALVSCSSGGEELCQELCGTEGAVAGCIPNHWESEEACLADCQAWGVGPALSISACLNALQDGPFSPEENTAAYCAEHGPEECLDPAAQLPEGILGFCDDLAAGLATCPGADMVFPSSNFCGWYLMGLMASIPGDGPAVDWSEAATCLAGIDACAVDGLAWMGCVLEQPQGVEAACIALQPCLDEYSPDEGFATIEECTLYVSMVHARNPAQVEAVIACINAAEGCGEILACVGGQ